MAGPFAHDLSTLKLAKVITKPNFVRENIHSPRVGMKQFENVHLDSSSLNRELILLLLADIDVTSGTNCLQITISQDEVFSAPT